MNSADIKRQILESSDVTGIRKKMQTPEFGLNNDEIVEMAYCFEEMVKTKGWVYIEAYILKNSNPVGLLFDDDNPIRKGEARALVKIMQYVDQVIKAKNDILRLQDEKE